MKKKILGAALIGVLGVILILFMLPGLSTIAAPGNEDMEIEGVVLRRYLGDESKVKIPARVAEIGPEAFRETKLKSITIPSTVRRVDERAFYGCKKLERVTVDEGVEFLGDSAFANCPKLNSVVLPSSVKDISPGVFAGCTALSNVELSKRNENFFYNDGVIYNKDSTRLVQYLSGRKSTSFEMPFTVEKIDRYAFWGANLLTDVRLSNNIKVIPDHAFSGCVGLTSVYLPESVAKISSYGFSDCTNLTYVAMENPVIDIDKTAFSGCSNTLKAEAGISEEEAKKVMGYSAFSINSDSTDDVEKQAASDDADAGTLEEAGKDSEGNKIYKKSFASAPVPVVELDDSDKDLIGQTKVSGHNALVIPK